VSAASFSAVAATLARTTHCINGWTIGFHHIQGSTLGGWFERDSSGAGGNLVLELDNGPGNTLQLVDYDGVVCLPGAVLTFLRQAGVDADSSFE